MHEPLVAIPSFLPFFTVLGSPVAVGDAPHAPAPSGDRRGSTDHRLSVQLASARDAGALLTTINYDQQPLQEMAVSIADLARARGEAASVLSAVLVKSKRENRKLGLRKVSELHIRS